uniref:Psag1 n=1 Tax=Dunaliella tertiolecta TaxID=3047 RepID=A0AC62AEM0_DUNTE|mmetsp:Transcript_4444/g.12092  ORF Transcript_4444/g.12092 Transcript_4444/m.12092 type:complete len:142 (+) Transcript_4444:58-483(+)
MALSSKASIQQFSRQASQSRAVARPASSRQPLKTRAMIEAPVAIGGSTVALLGLGRFVFLPYQRRRTDMEVGPGKLGPKTTGDTFFDRLQKPASFVETKSKDPSGFGIIDVLGWGALGHVFGYFLLACSSLQDAGIDAFPR